MESNSRYEVFSDRPLMDYLGRLDGSRNKVIGHSAVQLYVKLEGSRLCSWEKVSFVVTGDFGLIYKAF